MIRHTKIPNRATLERITMEAVEMGNAVRMAIERGYRIIMLDECYVTRNTIPKTAWSLKRSNIMLDYKETQSEVIAIAAAVSREYGMDYFEVFRHSINKTKFRKNPKRKRQ